MLDSWIERLTNSDKVKEELKRPIDATKDYGTRWHSFFLHCHIVYKLDKKYQNRDGMIRSLLEKAAVGKKGSYK